MPRVLSAACRSRTRPRTAARSRSSGLIGKTPTADRRRIQPCASRRSASRPECRTPPRAEIPTASPSVESEQSMRISLCNEVIAQLEFARQCELAATLGYDGLELAPFTVSEDPTRLSAARIAELRRAAADAGIAITGLHYLMRAP